MYVTRTVKRSGFVEIWMSATRPKHKIGRNYEFFTLGDPADYCEMFTYDFKCMFGWTPKKGRATEIVTHAFQPSESKGYTDA